MFWTSALLAVLHLRRFRTTKVRYHQPRAAPKHRLISVVRQAFSIYTTRPSLVRQQRLFRKTLKPVKQGAQPPERPPVPSPIVNLRINPNGPKVSSPTPLKTATPFVHF
ncbi:hypothetical protein M407DRAFT_29717 [Tulasnella calospora MUT 4182]|uniref:Uncharacterized protein n=1 Tax=Tulasnella calospora MUT 4182 TaxID=1051891 RepID=A0A0C3KGN5_9AGAM|nr:hypothetical protein M407DRAFT_29717 [Tulasnella calospora MUT 4182]